jgi:aminopeptidase N
MPGEITDKKNAEHWLIQYRNSHDYLNKRLALEGVEELKNNDTAEQIFNLALTDKNPRLRNLAINVKEYAANKKLSKEWIKAIGKIAETDNDNTAKASALYALGDLGNEEYISTYERNISDSSYKVATAALYALDKVNHKRAVEYARNFNLSQMKGNVLLYKASGIIAKDGKKEDFDFFERKTWQLFESSRMAFLNTVQDYLTYAEDIPVFTKGIALLQKLALKNPDAHSGFYAGAIIYNLKVYAEKNIKIATDKAVIEDWKTKKEIAISAWQTYKSTVKDDGLKLEIAKMEKE